MTNSPDVLVVGCGALGLSIAYNLARGGAHVVAVDRAGPGKQTSARAAGQSVIAQTDPAMGALMHRSVSQIACFEEETGIPFAFHQVGSVKYARSDWAAEQLVREVRRATALGARVEMISPADAAQLAPHTNPETVQAAWYAPDDLYFRPPDMVEAFHFAAFQAGVDFRFGVDVQRILSASGHFSGVQTNDGTISAGAVVVAAGSWTERLLRGIDVPSLPLLYLRHQYSIRRGIPGIQPGLPTVRVVDQAVYARPEGTDLMFGTYEPNPLVVGAVPARTEDVPLDATPIDEAARQVRDVFPDVVGSSVVELRGGVVSMTPDGSYLIDEAPTVAGAYFLTGCNVMGLSASPAIGADMAEWVISGRRPAILESFRIARFRGMQPSDTDIHRLGLAAYEAIYRDEESAGHVRRYGTSS